MIDDLISLNLEYNTFACLMSVSTHFNIFSFDMDAHLDIFSTLSLCSEI